MVMSEKGYFMLRFRFIHQSVPSVFYRHQSIVNHWHCLHSDCMGNTVMKILFTSMKVWPGRSSLCKGKCNSSACHTCNSSPYGLERLQGRCVNLSVNARHMACVLSFSTLQLCLEIRLKIVCAFIAGCDINLMCINKLCLCKIRAISLCNSCIFIDGSLAEQCPCEKESNRYALYYRK